MYVYKITNKITGKFYIGVTTKTPDIRWRGHVKSAKQDKIKTRFYESLRAHGEENFIVETLEKCSSKEEMLQREIFWIKELNTLLPSGYNTRKGGADYSLNCNQTVNSGSFTSESTVGEKNHFFGKTHKRESIEKSLLSKGVEEMVVMDKGFTVVKRSFSQKEIGDFVGYHFSNVGEKLRKKDFFFKDFYVYKKSNEQSFWASVDKKIKQDKINKSLNCFYRQNKREISFVKNAANLNRKMKYCNKEIYCSIFNEKYSDIYEAAIKLNTNPQVILLVCTGKKGSIKSRQFRFLEEKSPKVQVRITRRAIQCVETGEMFLGILDAAQKMSFGKSERNRRDRIEKSLQTKIPNKYGLSFVYV